MTSTQILIGSAAIAEAGDLVTTTNPAGEILVGFILQVLTGGTRLRPIPRYYVRVGSGGGKRLAWDAADCTWTTEERVAKALTVGERVHVYARGDWRSATVVSIGRTRVEAARDDLRNTYRVPAWQLLRVEAGR